MKCISAKSATQILSVTDEYTLRFPNILIAGLCNSSAIGLFNIFLLLIANLFARVTAPPADFLSKEFVNN